MTITKHLLTATALCALMGGAALAQSTDTMGSSGTTAAGAAADTSTSPSNSMPASPSMSDGISASGSSTSGTAGMSTDTAVNPEHGAMAMPMPMSSGSMGDPAMMKAGDPGVVSNGPIADTPENRAKYGAPMSRAGKRSAARGN